INTIGNLEPGKAYWVYVTCPCTLTYPPSPMKASASSPVIVPPVQSPWNDVYRTPNSHLIGIADEFAEQYYGKIIGVFNSAGMCMGLAEMGKENNVLIVYGDDPTTTETDGMAEGGEMVFRVYCPMGKTEKVLVPAFDPSLPDPDNRFVVNGISGIVKTTSATEYIGESAVKIFPNPAADFVNIEFGSLSFNECLVQIIDLNGRVVFEQTFRDVSTISINTGRLLSGMYHLTIRNSKYLINRKLVIR
nr:T9SS type A sorting domain-containing protein [Bacteroidota bacterium]